MINPSSHCRGRTTFEWKVRSKSCQSSSEDRTALWWCFLFRAWLRWVYKKKKSEYSLCASIYYTVVQDCYIFISAAQKNIKIQERSIIQVIKKKYKQRSALAWIHILIILIFFRFIYITIITSRLFHQYFKCLAY